MGEAEIFGEDALLVLEVSDATLRYDRKRKKPLYAKWGVPELWIENLEDDAVLIFRDPGLSSYANDHTLRRGESTSLAAFPHIRFAVDELLG